MTLFLLGIAVLALVGIGARWLFRQRDPSEIYAAREKIRRARKKRDE
jgi:hypothetical protein